MTPPQVPLDGIASAEPTPQPQAEVPEKQQPEKSKDAVIQSRLKGIIVVGFAIPYFAFIGWCMFLMAVLPDPEGTYESLIPLGSLTGFGGALAFFGMALFAAMRILRQAEKLPRVVIIGSSLRVAAVVLPGIVIGVMTPFVIKAEPKLWIRVTNPTSAEQMIAPLAVTLSAEEAQQILQRRGVRPTAYRWDFDGDGQVNEETVLPTATAFYSRMGLYNVAVSIQANDGKQRTVRLQLPIQKEVFQVTPMIPIVDEPAKFSVAHLVDLPEEIQEVRWDFNDDGEPDIVSSDLEVVHTFIRPGTVKIAATVIMQNQTQQQHERELTVRNPAPLPFDVRIESEPSILVSPAPFQTIFRVVTEEPIREVKWNFGDGEELSGERVGHTFAKKGNFVVTAEVRSTGGDVAKLTTLVRVVEKLEIPDLSFTGAPSVDMREMLIKGEVPLTLNLTPRSSLPLIEYTWEAPEATSVGSTDTALQAIYRRPDTYTVVLLAQDPAGHALRLPIRVEVSPPSTLISIKMEPEGGVAPLEVTFDASDTRIPGETVAGFEWLFGEEAEGQAPRPGSAVMRYTYEKPGTYTVRLLARTVSGRVEQVTRTIVVREPLLDACFTASRISGAAPLGVKFNMDCTAGKTNQIVWDFGDGATTDERNPIHVFEEPGEYTVELTIRDVVGNTSTNQLVITAE